MNINIGIEETICVEIGTVLDELERSELTGEERYCVILPDNLMMEIHMFCAGCDLSEDMDALLEFDRDMNGGSLSISGSGETGLYRDIFSVTFNHKEKNLVERILKKHKRN